MQLNCAPSSYLFTALNILREFTAEFVQAPTLPTVVLIGLLGAGEFVERARELEKIGLERLSQDTCPVNLDSARADGELPSSFLA